MNSNKSTPLLNAKKGKVGGGFKQTREEGGSPFLMKAQSSNNRQFANKYQKNAAIFQNTFDLSRAAHPVACIMSVVFKGISIFW